MFDCFLPLCRISSNTVKSEKEDPSVSQRQAAHLWDAKKKTYVLKKQNKVKKIEERKTLLLIEAIRSIQMSLF